MEAEGESPGEPPSGATPPEPPAPAPPKQEPPISSDCEDVGDSKLKPTVEDGSKIEKVNGDVPSINESVLAAKEEEKVDTVDELEVKDVMVNVDEQKTELNLESKFNTVVDDELSKPVNANNTEYSKSQNEEFLSTVDPNECAKDDNCTSGESENENAPLVIDVETNNKNNAVKRGPADNLPDQHPAKKLCEELQETFPKHDSLLSEYISSISYTNEEDINKHTENLIGEIEVLRELANAKEIEWNNLIHLRKVKEEILLRLLRKKNMLSSEKLSYNLNDLNKDSLNKQILELNKIFVEDKYDETHRFKHKSTPHMSGSAVQLNSSGLMMVPVSSSIYCQSNMNNINLENHMNPNNYKKNTLSRPVMVSADHRLPNFQMPELNGQSSRYNLQKGRQGAVKDVQSIIADHRQRYPDTVPRRGRRMKSLLNPQIPSTPRLPNPNVDHNATELGLMFGGLDSNSHLPPIDAVSLQQNAVLSQAGGLPNGMSFKDVLVQFANMTGQQQSNCMGAKLPPPPPYPEVTLHPVGTVSGGSPFGSKITQQQTNSLLHGILTKSQPRQSQDNRFSTFSPTLAQLLTAPEKNTPGNTCRPINNTNNYIQQKACSEITITAVQPTVCNSSDQTQTEIVQLDDFDETEPEEDSADRPLVIDESGRQDSNPIKDLGSGPLELNESEVPECQGCRKREAQFVCAGCANQWYCSRECQVSAWDEHSEVCTG